MLGATSRGLSDGEVEERLQEYGANELGERRGISPLKIFIGQFKSVLVLVLVLAAIISASVAIIQNTTEEWVDAIVILIIVVLNAILGFFQEYRAERTLQALKELASPKVTVIREDEQRTISSKDLVPGDIIVLATGDKVPADARLTKALNLKVNEAPLTGESVPVEKDEEVVLEKDTLLADRTNMVFSGGAVEYGRGKGVVVATGMKTELGRIAEMVQSEYEQTPLQKKLQLLGKQLGLIVLVIAVVIFAFGLFEGVPLIDMFLTAVSLGVAAIPEGLPAVVTISLAIGLQRMARRNALIRRLPAVESLGSATVICTDKTGTLTKGEMNVREIDCDRTTIRISGEGFEPKGEFSIEGKQIDPLEIDRLVWLLRASTLCNDSNLMKEEGRWEVSGDPTEGSLVVLATKAGVDVERLRDEWPRTFEIQFDSQKKRMITVHSYEDRKYAFLKGAPETTLPLCIKRFDGIELRKEDREEILSRNADMARRALRVLALAMREVSEVPREESIEQGFTYLGMVGMIDAPRSEATKAIAVAQKAGIRIIMITGDNPLTAKAIAQEMGITSEEGGVIGGWELSHMSEKDLDREVKEVSVFARVAPEDKVRIVDSLKRNGQVVAMTGDGVNDAPALKKSDIGIAMGITGTGVSKEAAEIVLTDDNFASIVSAVEEGRGIYDNIRRFVYFLLSCNSGEVGVMFFATLAFTQPEFLPFLLPTQLLLINLVTDGLPALALGLEPSSPDVMTRCPRDPREPPITRSMALKIVVLGVVMAIATLAVFVISYDENPDALRSRTMAITTLVLLQLFFVLSVRSETESIFRERFRTNHRLYYAFLASVGILLLIIYLPPLNAAFKTVPFQLDEWALVLPFSLAGLVANEVLKFFANRGKKETCEVAMGEEK